MVSEQNQVEIFRVCMQAIEQKKATVDQCVAHYPQVEGLRELLEASTLASRMPHVGLADSRKKALEQRLIAQMKSRKPATVQRDLRWWRRLPLAFMAALLFLIIGGTTLIRASASALPGDALYGLKRTSEQISLVFASSQSRPVMLVEMSEKRLSELTSLIQSGKGIQASFLTDVVDGLNKAAWAQPDPQLRAELYARSLIALQALTAQNTRPDLTAALNSAIRTVATPSPTPTVSAIPQNVAGTAAATEPIAATPSSTPTVSATPEGTVSTPAATRTALSLDSLRAKISVCVTDKGTTQSLTVKLKVNQLTPFINEVKAQSGKKIDKACADQLLELAASLQHSQTPAPTAAVN